jgi:hypothetical protein
MGRRSILGLLSPPPTANRPLFRPINPSKGRFLAPRLPPKIFLQYPPPNPRISDGFAGGYCITGNSVPRFLPAQAAQAETPGDAEEGVDHVLVAERVSGRRDHHRSRSVEDGGQVAGVQDPWHGLHEVIGLPDGIDLG